MPEQQSSLVFLFESYEQTLNEIRANRKDIKKNQAKNQELQAQLRSVKDSISGLLDIMIKEHGSLYKVCQKEFGIVDKRFYRIVSMFGKSSQ
jgi:hypothetical protein